MVGVVIQSNGGYVIDMALQPSTSDAQGIPQKRKRRSGIDYFRQHVESLTVGEQVDGTSNGYDLSVEMVMMPVYRAKALNPVTGKQVEHLAMDPVTLAWKLIGQQVNMRGLQWDKSQ